MHAHQKIFLLLALLLILITPSLAAPIPIGSITISGAERSSSGVWDSGTVTATMNGVSISIPYGQYSTPASIASALGALISHSCNFPVYAQASGATLSFYKKGTNVVSSASITSTSNIPSLFSNTSFLIGGMPNWTVPQITSLSFPEGPPSMGLVIYGAGFGDTPGSVTVGGVTANILAWSPTSITVQVPTGAVTGYVNVNTFGFPSNGLAFTVDAPFTCTLPIRLRPE